MKRTCNSKNLAKAPFYQVTAKRSKDVKCNRAQREIRNYDMVAYSGYEKASGQYTNPCANNLFSEATGKYISDQVTSRLGTELMGRPIVVPMKNIWSVVSALKDSYMGTPGGIIAGRYNIPNQNLNVFQSLVNEAITVIVDNARTSLEMIKHNGALSVWDTVLGDFNDKGLRSHPPLNGNINQTRRLFQINMNY